LFSHQTSLLPSFRLNIRAGYEVLLDFSIPPWFLDGVRAVLKEIPFAFVVVRPSEAVCALRAATRNEGTITDYTSYRELYADFAGDNAICDDTSEASVVAERIRKEVAAGSFIVESKSRAK